MDLRNWLKEVDAKGKLKVVRGAHWDLEIGAITELLIKKKGSPALLFDEIVDYPKGYRVAANTVTHASEDPTRVAIALGIREDVNSTRELVYKVKDRMPEWEAQCKNFPPAWVEGGPVMEEVYREDEVDMLKFPSPRWHEKDGGRYIGTGCGVITQDPETGQYNIGTYRVMVHDKHKVGIYMAPIRHGLADMRKYHAQGKPAPVVITLGQHPLFALVGGRPIPRASGPAQEFGYIGAIQGGPVPVVRGEVTGLPIPADAEIVIEGHWHPGAEMDEGPFGEFTGYYGGMVEPAPYIVVERLYHRKDPIILGSPPGKHPSYGTNVFSYAMYMRYLESIGVVGVTMLSTHRLASSQMAAVSVRQRYAGHAREVGHLVAQLIGRGVNRYVVVVDDDIDVTDIEDVTFAMASRADPAQDIDIIKRAYTQRLDPLLPQGLPREQYFNSRAIIDACIPFERRANFPEVASISPELADKTRAKWGNVVDFS
ncbi:MAG: UbiD family decarboxylase [Deltaproteobacteria bacterium]|nr:UbiD family decarboxylase [Deltaproteobacteria bacterium]